MKVANRISLKNKTSFEKNPSDLATFGETADRVRLGPIPVLTLVTCTSMKLIRLGFSFVFLEADAERSLFIWAWLLLIVPVFGCSGRLCYRR